MKIRLGCNEQHLIDFMIILGRDGKRRFSFAKDRATINACKSLERKGLVKVDWVTKQIVLNN